MTDLVAKQSGLICVKCAHLFPKHGDYNFNLFTAFAFLKVFYHTEHAPDVV